MSNHNKLAKPAEQKKPVGTLKTEPNKLIERIVSTGCLGAIIRLKDENVALRVERDRLRRENERARAAFGQLENVVKEKDRAFAIAIIERDAWHKTAEAIDKQRTDAIVRRDIYEGRAKLWQTLFVVTVLVNALVFVSRLFAR